MLTFVLLHLGLVLPALAFGRYHSNDSLADRRSGPQWLRAISSYLEFKTGDSWRRLSDPQQRWDPDRLWYLNGIDLMRTFLAETSGEISLVLPSPAPVKTLQEKTDELRAAKLATKPRAQLVGWLMDADPKLSDFKLLMGLSRPKLARMLIAARNANATAVERIA